VTKALTIEDLARDTGLTVRNIRSHRTMGLLPPPDVRDGVGYYDDEHVDRIRLIGELQAEGFNLKGIKRLLDETHSPASSLLGFRRTLSSPFASETAVIVTLEELVEKLGYDAAPETVARALEVSSLVPLGDGRFEVPSPSLLQAAEELVRRGIGLEPALSLLELAQETCDTLARSFIEVFVARVWKPFQESGYPQAQWSEVAETIDRLRPLASQAMLAIFQQAIAREIEVRLGRELKKMSKGKRPAC
jgi:DNA-binding transcriptional MerR regulator